MGKTKEPTPRGRGRPRARRTRASSAPPTKLSDVQLLTRAIAVTKGADGEPITDRAFAADVLKCHDRTLRKYLAGRPLPALAREKLVELVATT